MKWKQNGNKWIQKLKQIESKMQRKNVKEKTKNGKRRKQKWKIIEGEKYKIIENIKAKCKY